MAIIGKDGKEYEYIWTPAKDAIDVADILNKLNIPPENIVYIGDNPATGGLQMIYLQETFSSSPRKRGEIPSSFGFFT